MPVMIGIDPHKSTHTAVAVDRDEQPVARLTLPALPGQTERLLAWAEPLDAERVWAIEAAAGLGRLLAQQLVAAGVRVIDVPPTLSARVRLSASGGVSGRNEKSLQPAGPRAGSMARQPVAGRTLLPPPFRGDGS